ncbi:MAG: branched-chain amino acid ABC transporter permease, partial [Lapillicoccus sp.]
AGVALVVLLAVVTELGVVRPVQRRSGSGDLPALVSVAAVLFAVQQAAGLVFGPLPLPGQQLVSAGPWEVGGAAVFASTIVLIVVTVATFVAVTAWTRFTRMGRMLRAVGDNKEAAAVLGLPVGRVRVVAFAIGGVIAAVAGILFSTKSGVSFTSGLGWTLTGFLALVVGGTGSTWGPLAGGLLLGAVQVFTPFYFSTLGPQTVILVIALTFFAFKPEGLFVRRVRV